MDEKSKLNYHVYVTYTFVIISIFDRLKDMLCIWKKGETFSNLIYSKGLSRDRSRYVMVLVEGVGEVRSQNKYAKVNVQKCCKRFIY